MKQLLVAFALAILSTGQAQAADPQKFKTEESATKFCHAGNVVWFNPESKIYFSQGSQFYGHTKAGGFTCKPFAEKLGYRATGENAAHTLGAPPPAARMDNTNGAPPPAMRMGNTVGAPPPAARMENSKGAPPPASRMQDTMPATPR